MTKFYKPRKDLWFSSSLLPQKVANGKQYRFEKRHAYEYWVENGRIEIEALKNNFIEVKTEEECTVGFR